MNFYRPAIHYGPQVTPQQQAALAVTLDDQAGLEQAVIRGADPFVSQGNRLSVAQLACQHQSLDCLDVLWKLDPSLEQWQAISRWAGDLGLDAAVVHLMGKGVTPGIQWKAQELTLEMIDHALGALDDRRKQLGLEDDEMSLALLPFLNQVKVVHPPQREPVRGQPLALEEQAWETGAVLVFEKGDQPPTLWLAEPLAKRLAPALVESEVPSEPEVPVRRKPRMH